MGFCETAKRWTAFIEGIAFVGFSFMGFGLVRLWLLNLTVTGLAGAGDFDFNSVFWLVLLATIAGLLLLVRRIGSLHDSGPVFIGSVASTLAGTVCLMVSAGLGSNVATCIIGDVLSAAGYTAMLMLWFELFGCISSGRMVLAYACSNILGAAIWQLLSSLSIVSAYVLLLVLPLLSAAALLSGFGKPEAQREAALATTAEDAFPSLAPFWRSAVWIGCFSLATGFFLSYRTTLQVSLAYVLTGLLVIIGAALFSKRFDFSILYRISLPFIIVGIIVAPFIGGESPLASLLVSVGKEAALTIALAIACNVAYRRRISAAYTAGIVYFANIAAMLVGKMLQTYMGPICEGLGVPESAIFIGICVLCVVAAALEFNENHFFLHWEETELPTKRRQEKEELAERRIHELARSSKLSPREEEIFSLMAQGRSYAEIADDLFISQNTVRVHANHIFSKIGAKDRESLLEIVKKQTNE